MMAPDDDADPLWQIHRLRIDFAARSIVYSVSGIDLEKKSTVERNLIDRSCAEAYRLSSRHSLEEISASTWALLLLFGIYRQAVTSGYMSSAGERLDALRGIRKLMRPLHSEIEQAVAAYVNRHLDSGN